VRIAEQEQNGSLFATQENQNAHLRTVPVLATQWYIPIS